ncbi:hypothetical protein STENM223S_03095 [Streptomyces tendae]
MTVGPICHTDDKAAVSDCRLLLEGGQVGQVDEAIDHIRSSYLGTVGTGVRTNTRMRR